MSVVWVKCGLGQMWFGSNVVWAKCDWVKCSWVKCSWVICYWVKCSRSYILTAGPNYNPFCHDHRPAATCRAPYLEAVGHVRHDLRQVLQRQVLGYAHWGCLLKSPVIDCCFDVGANNGGRGVALVHQKKSTQCTAHT